jgi:hypothetical protein
MNGIAWDIKRLLVVFDCFAKLLLVAKAIHKVPINHCFNHAPMHFVEDVHHDQAIFVSFEMSSDRHVRLDHNVDKSSLGIVVLVCNDFKRPGQERCPSFVLSGRSHQDLMIGIANSIGTQGTIGESSVINWIGCLDIVLCHGRGPCRREFQGGTPGSDLRG